MNPYAVLLLIAAPIAGFPAVHVDQVTAWDAQLQGTFGALTLADDAGVVVRVEAELLVVHVQESTRVRANNVLDYWTSPQTTIYMHHDAELVARSFNGYLVVLSDGATFRAGGSQINVEIPTLPVVSDKDVDGNPPQRDTRNDLVLRNEVVIDVAGNFRLGMDQYLTYVDDGSSHIYDARTDRPRDRFEVDEDARHVIVEAYNATLRTAVPEMGQGGLYFTDGELQARSIEGLGQAHTGRASVERDGELVALETLPAEPSSEGSSGAAPGLPGAMARAGLPWIGFAAATVILALLVMWRGWRDTHTWTRRADRFLDGDRDRFAHACSTLAVACDPSNGYAWHLRGWTHSRRHQWKRSLMNFDRAYELAVTHEERAAAALDAARACAGMGQTSQARTWLQRAFQADGALSKVAGDDPLFADLGGDPVTRSMLGLPSAEDL